MKGYEILSNCCDARVDPIPQGPNNPDGFMYQCQECNESCDVYLY